ncbi:hypothetical protein [Pontibacter pamirensis]|uniref:hypothetical protein n=1 Tax=Pontibacter pamirensis TaxID=2562824 RepID=UPI00138A03A7|nr:hypothetical protein [Pontibacter pamirensis]
MKNRLQQFLSLCLVCSMTLLNAACKKDDKASPAEQAKVTGISIALTSAQKGRQDVSVEFSDLNGLSGKTSPNTITLDANTSYTGTLILEDANQTPVSNVTTEYDASFHVTNASVTFSKNGQEIQVETTTATSGSAGTVHVELRQNGQTQQVSFPIMVRD